MSKKAVLLLSGGLDSATVLADLTARGFECHTLAVDYGQRHRSELLAAKRVSQALGGVSHRVVAVDLRAIGGSALTDDALDVPTELSEGIPITYVPARNTLMLALALGHAEVLGAGCIGIGVNAVDYSGYPDCRPAFIEAFQVLANLATQAGVEGQHCHIDAPLMHMTKAKIIQHGLSLGVDYSITISCYQATDGGEACGVCDSCRLRQIGFKEAGVADPTRYAQS